MSVAEQDERAQYREWRTRRLAPLPGAALTWCAFAPGWPEEVVAQLGGRTPAAPFDLRLLERAVELRVLERVPGTSPWEGPIYRMPAPLRAAAVEELLEGRSTADPGQSRLGRIRRDLVAAGGAMLAAGRVPYDPVLHRWASVAAVAASDTSLASFLDDRVTEAIDAARQSGSVAAPEALRWIEAVEPLAQLFKGTLESAVTMARGKRELFYRRADDERRLTNYYPPPDDTPRLARPRREQAFHALLDDPEHWALHYVGSGGGGKTMLLRYIATRLAPQAGAAVARVDFDFLNPDYPLREPGMLLARFAEELRLQAGTEQGAFSSFDSTLRELNAWIAQEREQGRDGIVTVRDQPFRDAINAFARACRRLDRTIVLMLDTCEELAKLRGDQIPENVQVTFDVLTALRDEERIGRRLRVVFSGRRALGSAGFEWTAPESKLPPRPFLRLFRIRGFTEAHARGFLSSYRAGGVGVRADLHEDILRLSEGVGGGTTDDEDTARFLPPAPDDGRRFNPYDVDMYADWASSVEAVNPLTPERLARAGPHFYIEERIARRLTDDMSRLLPALTLLGRFDRQLLEGLVAGSPRAAALIVEITEQEWVRPDRSAAGDKWFIDEGLRARLRRYFEEQRPGALDAGRRLLADVLPHLTLTRPFAQLAERYFVATFDALADHPEQAAAWWLAVEQRILEAGAWDNWARPLVAELLSDPIMDAGRATSFRPAVLALQAAAQLHTRGAISPASWKQVEESIDRYPAVTGRERLRYRLECALRLLAADGPMRLPPDRGDAQCWGALAAAMEAAVEGIAEQRRRRQQGSLLASILQGGVTKPSQLRRAAELFAAKPSGPQVSAGAWPADAPPPGWPQPQLLASSPDIGVRALGLLLEARLAALNDGRHEALDAFTAAAHLAAGAAQSRWLDWIPPDHLFARTLLESLRAIGEEPEMTVALSADNIDADRLSAARLLLRDADVPQRDLPIGVTPLWRPRCGAHREIPPYDVVVCEITGRDWPGPSIDRLKEISQRATAAAIPEVAADADRAIARTIRRHRLLSEGWPLPASIVSSIGRAEVRLRVVTRALHISADAAARALADQASPRPTLRANARRAHAEALVGWAEVAQFTDDESVPAAFAEAESLFDDVEDRSSALRARIARASWLARHGKRAELQALLSERPLPLPGSQVTMAIDAQDAVHGPILETIEALDDSRRPWAIRALAAAFAAADEKTAAERNALARWVREHYEVEIDGVRHLPAEVVLVDAGPAPAREASSPAAPAPGRASGGSRVAIAGSLLILLVFLAVLLFGSFRVTTAAVPDWPTVVRWIIAVLLIPAGFGALALLSPIVLRNYGALLMRLIDVSFEVTLRDQPADVNRPMSVPWAFVRRARLFSIDTRAIVWTRPATGEERYEKLRETLGLRRSPLIDFLLAMVVIPLPVRVVIEPQAAAAPWEVLFGTTWRARDFRTNFAHAYRSLKAYRTPAQRDWTGRVTMLTWLAPGLHIARSSFSFRKKAGAGEWAIGSETAENPRQYEEPRPQAGVVHVVGTPVERRGTVYLEIAGHESGADSGGYLLSVEDLVRRYPALRILIVQITPSAALERSASDLLDAAYLKRLGAAAFQAGVPAVIVVPAIPPQVTEQIATVIFEALKRNRGNGRYRLIAAHREIQRRISRGWNAPTEKTLPIVLDCCLYLADHVNLRIRPEAASPPTPLTNGAST
jgi:hypothetical protein